MQMVDMVITRQIFPDFEISKNHKIHVENFQGRNFIRQKKSVGCSTTLKRAYEIENRHLNNVNDVIDLNQRKLVSGLTKLSSHDLAYN